MGLIQQTDTLKTVQFIGLVIDTFTQTYDCGYETFYFARIWDWETLSPKTVKFAENTDHWMEYVKIDASPEVLKAFEGYIIFKQFESIREIPFDLKKGFLVEVISGRKVPIGTIGTVQAYYKDQYGMVYIKTANNIQYKTYENNIKIIALPINEGPKYNIKALNFYKQCLHQKEFNKEMDKLLA